MWRKWEVVDDRGNVEDEYWFKKSADEFCREMNAWSKVYYDGRRFKVRRKHD